MNNVQYLRLIKHFLLCNLLDTMARSVEKCNCQQLIHFNYWDLRSIVKRSREWSSERWLHVGWNVKLIFKRIFYSIENISLHVHLEITWFNPLNEYKILVKRCRRNLFPKEVWLFIFSWVQRNYFFYILSHNGN